MISIKPLSLGESLEWLQTVQYSINVQVVRHFDTDNSFVSCWSLLQLKVISFSWKKKMPDPPINPQNFGIGIPNPIGPAVFSALERPR
jgi:hypothetical protein